MIKELYVAKDHHNFYTKLKGIKDKYYN